MLPKSNSRPTRARSVRCGFNFTLATLDTPSGKNVLFGFGKNNKGQLGVGDTKDSAVLQPVGFQDPVSVAAGWFHALASDEGGSTLGVAHSRATSLCVDGYGDGKDTLQLAPQRVSAVTAKVTQVVCGRPLGVSGRQRRRGYGDQRQWAARQRRTWRRSRSTAAPHAGTYSCSATDRSGPFAHCRGVKIGRALRMGQLDTSWSAGQRDALLCAERCTAASCYLHGDVLA